MIGAGVLLSLAGIVAAVGGSRQTIESAGKDRIPAGGASTVPTPGRPAPSGGVFVAYHHRLGKPRPTDTELADLLRPVPLETTEEISPWPFGIVSSACYSPDGRLLALGCGDGSVTLYDTAARRICSTRGVYAGRVWSMAFSPDGGTLATASGDWNPRSRNGQVRLWDVPSGTFRAGLTDDGSLQLAVAYSPDGRTLAWAGRKRTIVLWDTESQSIRAVCRGHEWTIRSLAFHTREPVLVSAGFDGSIRFWDARSGDSIGDPIRHDGRSSNRVAISPDGRLLAANSAPRSDEPGVEGPFPGWITIWDWETRKELRRIVGFRFDVLSIAFSPDGTTLASAGGYFDRGSELGLWDVATGDRIQGLKGHACWVESAIFSPDGRSLVSLGGADPYGGEVRVWDLMRTPSSAVR
jgi:WD40 repeat protein